MTEPERVLPVQQWRDLAAAMTRVAAGLDEYADEHGESGDTCTAIELTDLAGILRTLATWMTRSAPENPA
jgi:hypothetical protein